MPTTPLKSNRACCLCANFTKTRRLQPSSNRISIPAPATFYQDFADSLSLLDEVILVDIYPAREAPIPGVTSKLIYDNLRPGIEKSMCKKEDILNILKDKNIEVLITLGAGDIDNYVPEIKELLETKKLRIKNEE